MIHHISSNRTDRSDDTSSQNTQRNKPNEPPRDDRFRKAYKENRPTKEEEELASVEEKEEQPPSLFDLSKKKAGKSKTGDKSSLKDSSELGLNRLLPKQEQNEENSLSESQQEFVFENNSDASNGLAKSQQQVDQMQKSQRQTFIQNASIQQENLIQQRSSKLAQTELEPKEASQTTKKEKLKDSGQSNAKVDKAENISTQAHIQSVGFQIEKSQQNDEVVRSATIRELANQIVDRIQIMRQGDLTKTMITLRQPPILEGATITLTTSDHAKKEFNISFANLTPDAKVFLDRKLNEDSLSETLKREGFTVHIISTTTQVENLITTETGQNFQDRQDQQQQQQRQKKQNFQDADDES